MSEFRKVQPEELTENTFKLIGSDWMLITAGPEESYNTMTASWGGFGVLWDRKICFCVIRPNRYTYRFVEQSDHFTLSFFDEKYRDVLDYCGSKSGRDVDKASETGIQPIAGEKDSVYFAEARLVILCRKIYYQDLQPANFLDPKIENHYPNKQYHRMYVGEIEQCLIKKNELRDKI